LHIRKTICSTDLRHDFFEAINILSNHYTPPGSLETTQNCATSW
jgi:hypothetical protein